MTALGRILLVIFIGRILFVIVIGLLLSLLAYTLAHAEEPTIIDIWQQVDERLVTPNAYGPGIDMDATGAPIIWEVYQPNSRVRERIAPNIPVQPDAYGLGVGMDVYGRPVRRGRQ